MSLPICDMCAKTGVLCNVCEKKLESGNISEIDVEISRILSTCDDADFGFDRAIELEGAVIILAKKPDANKLINSGSIINTVSNELCINNVKVISVGSVIETIRGLIAPARVIGVNKVFKKDGSTGQRVRVDIRDKNKIKIEVDELKDLISNLSESDVDIIFE